MLKGELQNFGLSEKEARVYVAALELGTSTVQELSKKSSVNRATTYIQVDTLLKRGLLSSVEKGKKTLFIVEKPQKILDLLEREREEVEAKERRFKKLMPDLEAIYNVLEDRPRVRFFSGEVGLSILREEIMQLKPEKVYTILPRSIDVIKGPIFKKLMKSIGEMKILFVNEKPMGELSEHSNLKIKYLEIKDFDLEINLYLNKMLINKPIDEKQSMAILIEDKTVYQSFLAMHNMFWQLGKDI